MWASLLAKFLALPWLKVGQTLVKNWQTCLVVAFALMVFHYCRARDAEHVEAAKAEQRSLDMAQLVVKYRKDASDAAESLAVYDQHLTEQHADYEQELGLLRMKLGRVDTLAIERWLHDTVRVAGDSTKFAIPASAILVADSSLKVCREIIGTCAQAQAAAARRHTADSLTILELQKPSLAPNPRRCGIQLTAGLAAVAKSPKAWTFGPGGTLGLGCRW